MGRQARCGCDFEGQPEPPVAPPPRIALDNTAAAAARRAALSPGGQFCPNSFEMCSAKRCSCLLLSL